MPAPRRTAQCEAICGKLRLPAVGKAQRMPAGNPSVTPGRGRCAQQPESPRDIRPPLRRDSVAQLNCPCKRGAPAHLPGLIAAMHELLEQRIRHGLPATLRVKVTPKSPKTEISGELADGTLKIRIAAAPERGKANAELCSFLADEIGVASSKVEIVSGHTSPLKLVRISR